MAERKFAIRLSVEDMEKVRNALRAMGAEGVGALKALDQASMKTTPELKKVDDAAKGVWKSFDQAADRIPVIGGLLKSLGPAGLAAAGAIGAAAAAALSLWESGQKAREELDRLKTAADNLGTSAETYQALEAAAIENDIAFDKLQESLNKLNLSAALASKGKGELYETLKKLNPELLKEITLADTQEDRWNLVSRAITAQTSQVEKIIIAKAAFGEQGGKLVRLLDGEGKTIEALTNRYRELGLVIDEELVVQIAEADRRLDLANKRMEVDAMRAGAALLPVIEGLSNVWTGLNIAIGEFFDRTNPTQVQQIGTIRTRIAELNDEMARLSNTAMQLRNVNRMGTPNQNAETEARINALRREREMLEMEIEIRKLNINKGAASPDVSIVDQAELDRQKVEADRKAAEAARKLMEIEKAAIAIRKEAGDWTGVYAAKVAELTPLVGQFGVTQEHVNRVLADYKAQLEGTTEFQTKLKSAVDALKSPAERARAELEAFEAAASRLGASGPEVIAVIGGMTENIRKLEQAETLAFVTTGTLGDTLRSASEGLKAYAKETDKSKDSTFELRFAAEAITGVFDDQINTLEDLGKVAVRIFRQMAMEALLAQTKMQLGGGGSGGGGFDLIKFIGSLFGGGGGASGGAGNAGGSNSASGGGSVVTRRMHDGGVVSLDDFRNAKRAHTGFAPDEVPIIAQTGERMLSRADNAVFTRAIERLAAGGAAGVSIRIVDETGAKFETTERQSADGGRELEIRVKQMTLNTMASDDGQRIIQAATGGGRPVRVR